MITAEENLKTIVEEIRMNEIMLPDFQRQFDWSLDKQRALIASVLTKIPVGGILLLRADSNDYKSKCIGLDSKESIKGDIPEKTDFLLDGQQRITCLTNVFSDVIHIMCDRQVHKLASRKLLTTRFYLKVNKWSEDIVSGSVKDLFGIRTLDFRFDVSKNQEPDFLTADIIDSIICRSFYSSQYGKEPYMPGTNYNEQLDDYCMNEEEYYLIPLYLLIGSDTKDERLRKKRLLAIVESIKNHIIKTISTRHNYLENEEKKEFAFSVLIDEEEQKTYNDSIQKENNDEIFEGLVKDKAMVWADAFEQYLYSCVQKVKLNRIEMPEGSRARAIDIYENMNMGGMSLSTMDLVAARVAKVSHEPLYDRILQYLSMNYNYNVTAIPSEIKKSIPEEYNASKTIKAIEKRLSKNCSDLFLEVLGLYCNNKTYDPEKIKATYSKSNEVLKLSEEEINQNCEKVCIAIDRTFCFLQVRCGIRSLSEVNYKIMIRFIAYIFTNDKWYVDEEIHDKIEAWYWAAIFSGEYDKDQNDRYESNLRSMLESLNSKDYEWIVSLKNNILETPYFSDSDFLIMENSKEGRLPKKHLNAYFCQFYLSRPYPDLIVTNRIINVFSEEKLEKHHIVPLGSVSNIGQSSAELRNDKSNILNSPLNYIYVTDITNREVSSKSLSEYQEMIVEEARASLNIVNYPIVKDLSDHDKIKSWLLERHKNVKGEIQKRVTKLLSS